MTIYNALMCAIRLLADIKEQNAEIIRTLQDFYAEMYMGGK